MAEVPWMILVKTISAAYKFQSRRLILGEKLSWGAGKLSCDEFERNVILNFNNGHFKGRGKPSVVDSLELWFSLIVGTYFTLF